MRRFFISLVAIFFASAVSAEEPVWQVLQRVSEYMNAQKGYEVKFAISAADYTSAGRYCVKGDAYYIDITDAEVYCDGEARYEVDNQRKEVTIDVMDYSSRNILDNPTRCFDFVEEDYEAAIVEQSDGEVVVRLQAKDQSIEGEIVLVVESNVGRPKSVEYRLYGDSVVVEVKSIDRASGGAVKRFNRSAYKDFEIIDFR